MELIETPQSTSTAQQMAYAERLVIELSDPDLREDTLCVLSMVLPTYLLFVCLFLMSFIGFTINLNLKGVAICFTVIQIVCVIPCQHRFI